MTKKTRGASVALVIALLVFTATNATTFSFVKPKGKRLKRFKVDNTYRKGNNEEYKKLMSEYSAHHYGTNTYRLSNPKIVVLHSTYTRDLKHTLNVFDPTRLYGREDIEYGGNVNVGAHFLIDYDGTVYAFHPPHIMARHTIGLNHTAIGIENIAASNEVLTEAQLESSVKLILYLKMILPSIQYVIGHYEYTDTNRPHYKEMLLKDKTYRPHGKRDPGKTFMKKVRKTLKDEYGIEFLD